MRRWGVAGLVLGLVSLAGCIDEAPTFLLIERSYGLEIVYAAGPQTLTLDDVDVRADGFACREELEGWLHPAFASGSPSNDAMQDGWQLGESALITPNANCVGWNPGEIVHYEIYVRGVLADEANFGVVFEPVFTVAGGEDGFTIELIDGRDGLATEDVTVTVTGTLCTDHGAPGNWSRGEPRFYSVSEDCPGWTPRESNEVEIRYRDRLLVEEHIAIDFEPTFYITWEDENHSGGDSRLATSDAITYWRAAGYDIVEGTDPTGRWQIELQFVKQISGYTLGQHDPSSGIGLTQVGLGSDLQCSDGMWIPYDETTLAWVARHELGHALGLDHASTGVMQESYAPTFDEPCVEVLLLARWIDDGEMLSWNWSAQARTHDLQFEEANGRSITVCLRELDSHSWNWCEQGATVRVQERLSANAFDLRILCDSGVPHCEVNGGVHSWPNE